MNDRLAEALDECCVLLLRATSSPAALVLADHDERALIPVYDHAVGVQPRQQLVRCPAPGCGRRFWTPPTAAGLIQRYCGATCRNRVGQTACRRRGEVA